MQEEDMRFFDCPRCRLPAEVFTYATYYDVDAGIATRYVIIDCVSGHDMIPIPEPEFTRYLLSQQ